MQFLKDLKISGVSDKGCYNKSKTLKAESNGVITKFRVNDLPKTTNYFTTTADGRYKVDVELASGVSKNLSFIIDTVKPTTNISAKTYKKGQKITFKDTLSGIRKATLNNKVIKNGVKVKKSGKYTLKITDKAGNTKTVKFKVK